MGRSRDMDASDTKGYMHDILKSGKYSDFSIVCEDFTFKVHRCIIESSQFFSAAINSGLKETKTNVITICETGRFACAALILFIYTKTYEYENIVKIWPELEEDIRAEKAELPDPLPMNVIPARELSVYLLADRLLLSKLRDIAVTRIYQHDRDHYLPESCAYYFANFARTVFVKTSTDDDTLRPITLAFAVNILSIVGFRQAADSNHPSAAIIMEHEPTATRALYWATSLPCNGDPEYSSENDLFNALPFLRDMTGDSCPDSDAPDH